MKKLFVIFILLLSLVMNPSNANESDEFQGFKIKMDEDLYEQKKEIYIRGSFSIFVNCGSQYAIWGQFPQAIRYKLKDLDSDTLYQSINMELSISWDGNQVYEDYAKMPCNKIITESFHENLHNIYFENAPDNPIKYYEVQAEYMNFVSEWIKIDNKPIQLKKL